VADICTILGYFYKRFFAAVRNRRVSIAAFIQARISPLSPTTQAVRLLLSSVSSRPPII
jgi:hypothetical protein